MQSVEMKYLRRVIAGIRRDKMKNVEVRRDLETEVYARFYRREDS